MSHRALKFDWEDVELAPISAVVGQNERVMNDGSLVWDAVAFVVGDRAVALTVTEDTDEIVVTHDAKPEVGKWQPIASLSDVVGQSLGWSWVGTNYRGYADTITLAIGADSPESLTPRLMFLCEGSTLSCFQISAVRT